MARTVQRQDNDEPVGIVISRGSRAEPVPVFRAYMWGPAPDSAIEEGERPPAEPRAA